MSAEPAALHDKVNEILQRYRATPLSCGKSPAEIYYNRRIRIRLDAIKPTVKFQSTKPIPGVRQLSVGERVQVLHTKNNKTVWKTGTILQKFGQLHYLVKLDDGYMLKRHIDQLKATRVQARKVHFDPAIENKSTQQPEENYHYYFVPAAAQNQTPIIQEPSQPPSQENRQPLQEVKTAPEENQPSHGDQQQVIRRSQRSRNRPAYLREYVDEID